LKALKNWHQNSGANRRVANRSKRMSRIRTLIESTRRAARAP
jgi:hypothetical protein